MTTNLKTLCMASVLLLLASPLLAQKEVKNGQSNSGSVKLNFSEDLRIEDDGEDHTLWIGTNVGLAVDSKGNMYVSDPKENRIVVLQPSGEHHQTIGKQGQGPGEFQQLHSYQVLADDRGIAWDSVNGFITTYSIFDASGKFVERKQPKEGLTLVHAQLSPDGSKAFGAIIQGDPSGKSTQKSVVMDSDFNILKEISSLDKAFFDASKLTDPNFWVDFLGQSFRGLFDQTGYAAFLPDGSVLTAVNQKYIITKWNNDMKPTMVIHKDYKPIPRSEEEINAITEPLREMIRNQLPPQVQSIVTDNVIQRGIEKAEFPPAKEPVGGLIPMPDGGFVVIHDISRLDGTQTGHLYSAEGKFLGSFERPNNSLVNSNSLFQMRMIFRGDKAYTIETNADFENAVVRYNVTR